MLHNNYCPPKGKTNTKQQSPLFVIKSFYAAENLVYK